MRIVAIRGENLASLVGPFAIELEQPPLQDLGLFAIHGPVGAGKSTLLDAMCLALFGRTPRLSGAGGAIMGSGDDDDVDQLRSNDPRTLIRRGTNGGHAEVDFIGADDRLYRARWEVARGRSRGGRRGRLKTEHHTIVDVGSGANLSGTKTETLAVVNDRLGLNFDELCRSVLLAQGGFQNFLSAKPAERASLLERITGTDIYSRLSMGAWERARDAQRHESALQAARDGLGVLDDDTRGNLERDVVLGQSAAAETEAALRHLTHRLEAVGAVAAVVDAKASTDTARRRHDDTQRRRNSSRQRRDTARDHARIWTPVVERHLETCGHLALAHETLAALRAEERSATLEATTAREAMRSAEAGHREQAARTQSLVEDVARQREALGAFTHRPVLDNARRQVAQWRQAETRRDGARALWMAAQQRVADANAAVDDADTRHTEDRQRLEAVLPDSVTVETLPRRRHDILEQIAGLASRHADRTLAAHRVQRSVRDGLARAASLVEQRQRLGDDEDCPLCGADVAHQHRQRHDAVASVLDDAEAALEALRLEEQRWRQAAATATARAQAIVIDEGADESGADQSSADQSGDVGNNNRNNVDDDDADLDARYRERTNDLDALNACQPALQALEQSAARLAEAQSALEDARHACVIQEAAFDAADAQVLVASDALADLPDLEVASRGNAIGDHGDHGNDGDTGDTDAMLTVAQVEATLSELQRRHDLLGQSILEMERADEALKRALRQEAEARRVDERATDALRRVATRREAAEVAVAEANMAVEAPTGSRERLRTTKVQLDAARPAKETEVGHEDDDNDNDDEDDDASAGDLLDALCPTTPATTRLPLQDEIERCARFLAQLQRHVDDANDDLAAASDGAAAAHAAVSAAEATLLERRRRLRELGIDEDDALRHRGEEDLGTDATLRTLRIEQATSTRARDDAVRLAADLRARLHHDDGLRARDSALAADLERHREQTAVWTELSSLIGSADGARFRHFAQGLTLDALILHANAQLTLLAPRYRLQRTNSAQQRHDLDLVVVDVESGDEMRSTATLSGGESFLVSLALALGLSSLSTNEGARGRVESLFIDEGFSALDQETLDIALSAFDALRQTGRQIGVISHVPLMVDRLGAQVRVVPMGGGASRVEVQLC